MVSIKHRSGEKAGKTSYTRKSVRSHLQRTKEHHGNKLHIATDMQT